MSPKPSVMLVDHRQETATIVARILRQAGFGVVRVISAETLWKAIGAGDARAIVLNAPMPDSDGVGLIRLLREKTSTCRMPILVLFDARRAGAEAEFLQSGATEFLVLGVNDLETLPLRLSRALRAANLDSASFALGGIRVDLGRKTVHVSGLTVKLRPREFDLLVYLMRRSPIVATWDELQRDVWGVPAHAIDSARYTHTIAVHCERLRKRLGPAGRRIVVRRGLGLQFDASRVQR